MTYEWKGSPNYALTRSKIDTVVIHWTGGGSLDSATTRFMNPASKVSAHYGIDGETVYQWVHEVHTAWHSGNYEMNTRSIGIEHVAGPDKPLGDLSYQTSAQLLARLSQTHGIPLDRAHVIKHSQVKATQCPGTMDLDKLIALAKTYLTPPPPSEADLAFQWMKERKIYSDYTQRNSPVTTDTLAIFLERYDRYRDLKSVNSPLVP